MTEEGLHSEFRFSSLDHRHDERRRAARLPETAWASPVPTFDPSAPHGLPRWALPNVSLTEREPRRVETRQIAPLTGIRRIVAAIRLWRGRARSQQELRELSDHMLKDIGLRREDVGYEFPKPFWYSD